MAMAAPLIKADFDLAIVGGAALLSAGNDFNILVDAFIGINGNQIVRICPCSEMPDGSFSAKETVAARGMVVLPGLINTHCHCAMSFFRGFGDDLPLTKWLFERIFPAERRMMNAETVYRGAKLALAEMLLAGITTVADSYFFEGAVARAGKEMGMRLVLCRGFFDPPVGVKPATLAQSARHFFIRYRGDSPLISPALFCHSLYTCSPTTLTTLKSVAREYDVPFMFHLLETAQEEAMVQERYGATVYDILTSGDLLDEKTLAIHCVHLNEKLVKLFAERGVKVSHNPRSNAKLACGIAPLPLMLAAGICVGLGTDGAGSNNRLDIFSEMEFLSGLHNIPLSRSRAIGASSIVRMATLDGAKALGLDSLSGSLEVGKDADIAIVDFHKPHLTPVHDYSSHLACRVRASDVHTTIVAGKVLVHNGALRYGDINEIMNAVRPLEGF
ncbi:MAG: amidohydrolase [Deltaproteobacteria bacterium]|nr:amidohydrolase [Deltaproteobacteria bacterium]